MGFDMTEGNSEADPKKRKSDAVGLLVLVFAACCLGVYLIATTVFIAQDGVMYIEYAKELCIEPAKAMQNFSPAPGYPFLICIANKLISACRGETSLEGWIISAQSVSLLCKIIATFVLYFVGRRFVGARMSFWGVLILTILPLSAEYGSDALTEWPHLMFLAIGFWLLLLGAESIKWWAFGGAGIIAGFGYLIRPESCQLVILGTAYLLFGLIKAQNKVSRLRLIKALIILCAGFIIVTAPYMKFKGYVFPEQHLGKLSLLADAGGAEVIAADVPGKYLAGLMPAKITGGVGEFVSNICEILMYYFVPFLLIGVYHRFRKCNISVPEKFFVPALILLHTVLLIWLYYKYGFMSKRYTLPLVSLTIFYVPVGLQVTSGWIGSRLSKGKPATEAAKSGFWFFALSAIGIAICLPKLVEPIRAERAGYREAVKWLRENTAEEDVIAVPDERISFYSDRKGVSSKDGTLPAAAEYVVAIVKNGNEMRGLKKEYSVWADKQKNKMIVICKRSQ